MAVVYVLGQLTHPFTPVVDLPRQRSFLGAHLSECQGARSIDYQLRVWDFALKDQLESLSVSARLQVFGRLTVQRDSSTRFVVDVAEICVMLPSGSRKLEPGAP